MVEGDVDVPSGQFTSNSEVIPIAFSRRLEAGGGWAGGKFRMALTRLPVSSKPLKNITIAEGELINMTDQTQSKILENNPIGKGLDAFRSSFNSICKERSISCTPDALDQFGQEGKVD